MKVSKDIMLNFIQGNFSDYTRLFSKDGEIHFNSPFYSDSKKRLYINVNNGTYFDQKLQEGGSFVSFAMEFLDLGFRETMSILENDYDDVAVDLNSIPEDEKEEQDEEDEEKFSFPNVSWFDVNKEKISATEMNGISYLLNRKINPIGLGIVADITDDYFNRIIVPFYENGEPVFFIARSCDPKAYLRYKNPKHLKSGDFVYNIDKVKDRLFIFEGVFDALSLENGVATAMLSNCLKQTQIEKICNTNVKEIIFIPDCDKKLSTRRTILKNLLNNVERIKLSAKNKINFYIYSVKDGYKDFNEYKVGTGIGTIDMSECVEFNKISINMEIAKISANL